MTSFTMSAPIATTIAPTSLEPFNAQNAYASQPQTATATPTLALDGDIPRSPMLLNRRKNDPSEVRASKTLVCDAREVRTADRSVTRRVVETRHR